MGGIFNGQRANAYRRSAGSRGGKALGIRDASYAGVGRIGYVFAIGAKGRSTRHALMKSAATLAVLSVFAGPLALDAVAQAVVIPPQAQPGRDRPIPVAPPPEANFDFSIQSPRRAPVPRAVDELKFSLKDIKISGASAYPPEVFRALYEGQIGTEVGLSDIIALAEQIEEKYHADGYVLSRAFVPPQRVADGVFQITVVEGYVKAISVDGGSEGDRKRIERMLQPVLDARPAQLSRLERSLLLANGLPGLQAAGLLRPSPTEPGASDLVVSLTRQPYQIAVLSDNRGARNTGQTSLEADLTINSPFNDGGQILLTANGTPEFTERKTLSGKYIIPIGSEGATLSMSGLYSTSEPDIQLNGANQGIRTKSYSVGPRVAYPLVASRELKIGLEGGFTWQSADTHTFVTTPFSHDEWRVVDAAINFTHTGFLDGVTGGAFGIAKGLPYLGATRPTTGTGTLTSAGPGLSRQGAQADFTKLTLSANRSQPIVGDLSAVVTMQGQYAFSALLSGEQISMGGAQFGRGYDASVLTGDHGVAGSFELRYDDRYPDYYLDSVQYYSFLDAGKVWSRLGDTGTNNVLASTGIGVRMTFPRGWLLGVEYARTLISLPTNDSGRTGSRILFNAAVRY